MGAGNQPGRREAVASEGRGPDDPGPVRPVEKACAEDADDGPLTADGSGLREDLPALHGEPGSVRGYVRPSVVQAHAPRHGSARALPRSACAEGSAHLARPDPNDRSSPGG